MCGSTSVGEGKGVRHVNHREDASILFIVMLYCYHGDVATTDDEGRK